MTLLYWKEGEALLLRKNVGSLTVGKNLICATLFKNGLLFILTSEWVLHMLFTAHWSNIHFHHFNIFSHNQPEKKEKEQKREKCTQKSGSTSFKMFLLNADRHPKAG